MSIYGIYIAGWELEGEPHFIIGLIVFFSVTFVALFGIFTRSRMVRLQWKTNTILLFKFMHKSAGFILVALS
jgi:hypothetical protein